MCHSNPHCPHGFYYPWTTDLSGSYPFSYQKSISLFHLRILIGMENIVVTHTGPIKPYSFGRDRITLLGHMGTVDAACKTVDTKKQRGEKKSLPWSEGN